MANIRVDVEGTIVEGQTITFKSPVDCSEVSGLKVYYTDNGLSKSQLFQFADTHGNNVGGKSLFAEGVMVKVILHLEAGRAYVQNGIPNISWGYDPPSGGKHGDIYFQIIANE